MKTYKDLKDPGYYWWLPEYLSDDPRNADNWQVISWHPENRTHVRAGFFVGPLTAPVCEVAK